MVKGKNSVTILIAEDDPDDRLLTMEAAKEARLANDIVFVEDGVELLDYLNQRGAYAGNEGASTPGLILLDLNLPRMDGREALAEIKADADFRRIPVIVMTTSKAEEDILRSYELGVSGYVTKPVKFDDLVNIIRVMGKYWFEIVELPPDPDRSE
jgi:CheY-like chemotaxis protein